jgi:hypothetical protein
MKRFCWQVAQTAPSQLRGAAESDSLPSILGTVVIMEGFTDPLGGRLIALAVKHLHHSDAGATKIN